MPSDHELSKRPKRKTAGTTKKNSKERDVGAALRSVYEKAVSEAIPDEMLDLLGKLN